MLNTLRNETQRLVMPHPVWSGMKDAYCANVDLRVLYVFRAACWLCVCVYVSNWYFMWWFIL